jgi:hypothetical protein
VEAPWIEGGAGVGGRIFLGGSPDAAGGFHRCSPFLGALPYLPLALHAGEATPAGRRPSLLALGHPCKRRPSALRSSPSVTDPPKPSHFSRLAEGVVPSTTTRGPFPRCGRRQEPQRTPVTPRKLPPAFRDPLRRFSLGEAPMQRGARHCQPFLFTLVCLPPAGEAIPAGRRPPLLAAGPPCPAGPSPVAHPLALRILPASLRVSFPPPLPEGTFRRVDDARQLRRTPATLANSPRPFRSFA